MTRLYDLETELEILRCYQFVLPFRFAGKLYPPGSWIVIDLWARRRTAMPDAQFRGMADQYTKTAAEDRRRPLLERARGKVGGGTIGRRFRPSR